MILIGQSDPTARTYEIGSVLIIERLWEQTGIKKDICKLLQNRKYAFNFSSYLKVEKGSVARIGEDCTQATFNAIVSNGQSENEIIQSSEATVRGAVIQQNRTNGIFIADGSMADTDSNTISENGGDGVDVRRGSSLRMSRRNTPVEAC
jgi:hypothetical protein